MRLELIEQLYERMYDQRREYGVDETKWPHRIMGGCQVVQAQSAGGSENRLQVNVQHLEHSNGENGLVDGHLPPDSKIQEEVLDVDLVISATGYQRNTHLDLMKGAWHLLPESPSGSISGPSQNDGWLVSADGGSSTRKLEVGRDYQVHFEEGKVASGSGLWLQGCCEGTHGVSLHSHHLIPQLDSTTNLP